MLWLYLALIPALAVAVRDVSIKTYEDLTPLQVAGVELFWSLPLLVAGLFCVEVPELAGGFWPPFLWSFPLNIAAYILYLYAIRLSPLSLSVPFLAFTPAFMLFTGLMVLGEAVNIWGGIGVGLIVAGSYLLHFNGQQRSLFAPFVSLAREKGSWLMLIVAMLYSFAAVVGKQAMLHSSPLFFSYSFFVLFNIVILSGLVIFRQCDWQLIGRHKERGLWLGVLLFLHLSFHGLAIVLAKAVYMIAVKRSSILFTVLLSWLVLREGHILTRGLGSLCMFAGVLCISLLG